MSHTNTKIFSYTDDTTIDFTGSTWADAKAKAEQEMTLVSSCLRNNLLTPNSAKTNYICFSIYYYKCSQPNPDFGLKIHTCGDSSNLVCNCSSINKIQSVKYLGVMLDQRLTWYP